MSILENIFKSYKTALDSLSDEELYEISHLIETNDATGKNDNAIKEFAEKHAAKFDYTDSIDHDDKNTFIKKLTEIEIGEPEDVTYQRFIIGVVKNAITSIASIITPRPNSPPPNSLPNQKSKSSQKSKTTVVNKFDLNNIRPLSEQVKNRPPTIPPENNSSLPEILPPSYDAANKLPPPVTQPIIPGNP
jgi:hypothetical protein